MTIAVLCAIAAGSLGGTLAAIRLHPMPPDTEAAAPATTAAAPAPPTTAASLAAPAAPPTTTTPPTMTTPPAATTPLAATTPPAALTPVAQPHAPDPQAVLVIQMRAVLGRVAEWAHTHAGEPCPDAATLGIAALDPWGHPIELTCTDQPADQMMGAISTGPDGIPGSPDDVKSWNLGPSVTQLVQGRRWPTRPIATKPTAKRRPASAGERGATILRTPAARPSTPAEPLASPAPPSRAATPSAPPPAPLDAGDDIPTRR